MPISLFDWDCTTNIITFVIYLFLSIYILARIDYYKFTIKNLQSNFSQCFTNLQICNAVIPEGILYHISPNSRPNILKVGLTRCKYILATRHWEIMIDNSDGYSSETVSENSKLGWFQNFSKPWTELFGTYSAIFYLGWFYFRVWLFKK